MPKRSRSVYDPAKVSYAKLLDMFWHSIDPLVKDKQFCDTRRPVSHSDLLPRPTKQKKLAEESKKKVEAKFAPRTVYTQIVKAGPFYKAEDYHQDYYKKNEARYKFYRWNCGRDQRLEQLWGKKEHRHDESAHNVARNGGSRRGVRGVASGARRRDAAPAEKFEIEKSDAEWRRLLTPAQYDVLRKHGTERAGTSPLNKEKRKGTFACAGCDLPLFSSETKFESGTGWPSF